jgi:hypothetical protein
MQYMATIVVGLFLAGCGAQGSHREDEVSDAQFKAAAQKAADCLAADGWQADGPRRDASGLGWLVGVKMDHRPDEAEQAKINSAIDTCWSQNAQAVADKYYKGLALTGAEREAAYGDFVQCLNDAGVKGVKVGDPEEKVGAAIGTNQQGVACMQRYVWLIFNDQGSGS